MNLKNNVNRIIISLLTVIMILVILPVGGFASNSITAAQAKKNAEEIFTFMTDKVGLNSAAACGVLANIECESNFNPNLSGDSGSSYGICQWNSSRFDNLKNYCDKNGFSWSTLTGQLNFLKYELTNSKSDTGYILSKLSDVDNTAQGAYNAGYDWCYYFERPSNKEVKSQNRGNMAKNDYWPEYKIEYNLGDVNDDGHINSADALLVLKYSVNSISLTTSQLKAADINKNQAVNSADALIILKISTGMEAISNYL